MAVMTFAQIEAVAIQGGFSPAVAPTMAAIALAESSGKSDAVQQGQPYAATGWGLWQITPGNSVPSVGIDHALLDPVTNARAAHVKYTGSGNSLRPWTTWTNGAYRKYLPAGTVAPDASGIPAARAGPTGPTATSPGEGTSGAIAGLVTSYGVKFGLIVFGGLLVLVGMFLAFSPVVAPALAAALPLAGPEGAAASAVLRHGPSRHAAEARQDTEES